MLININTSNNNKLFFSYFVEIIPLDFTWHRFWTHHLQSQLKYLQSTVGMSRARVSSSQNAIILDSIFLKGKENVFRCGVKQKIALEKNKTKFALHR